MARRMNKLSILLSISVLLLVTGCEVLDLLPGAPTLIPNLTPVVTLTQIVEQVTPTAPGFPTLPASETQTPTQTPERVDSAIPVEPGDPVVPTSTPRPEPYFALQAGNPMPMVNIARPDAGCNWLGFGGQIFDLQGTPKLNYLIQLGGLLGSEPISLLAITGGAPQFGAGGYLLEINSQPIESSGMLYLQVIDMDGRSVSDKVYLTTYSDCERNLLLVNFTQLPPALDNKVFLPSINKE